MPDTEYQLFLDEIRAHPDDDAPRLIFADWLEERGEPLAEFIRTQCALAGMTARNSEFRRLEAAARVFVQSNAFAELQALRDLGATDIRFQRGFVEHIRISAANFITRSDDLFEIAPIVRSVLIRRPGDLFAEVMNCRHLQRIEFLALRVNDLLASHARLLAGSPHVCNLRRLDLSGNLIGRNGLLALLVSPSLAKLEYLDLWNNGIGDDGAAMLVESELAGRLTYLELGSNGIGDAGADTLLRLPPNDRLRFLGLDGNLISEERINKLESHFGDRVRCERNDTPAPIYDYIEFDPFPPNRFDRPEGDDDTAIV